MVRIVAYEKEQDEFGEPLIKAIWEIGIVMRPNGGYTTRFQKALAEALDATESHVLIREVK